MTSVVAKTRLRLIGLNPANTAGNEVEGTATGGVEQVVAVDGQKVPSDGATVYFEYVELDPFLCTLGLPYISRPSRARLFGMLCANFEIREGVGGCATYAMACGIPST